MAMHRGGFMSVISMFSPKGGVGKTTTALVLGTVFAKQGYDVVMLDADPNGSLSQWDNAGELPNLRIVKEYDEEEIMSVILDNHKSDSIVIVDLDGRASTRATHAMLQSDLVLIPFGGSMLDAELAVKATKMVANVGAARGRDLEYRGILTKAPASANFYSRELISVLRILKALPFPILQTHVAERQAYRALFSFGGSLDTLSPKEVPGLDQAKQNANRLGLEIIDILSGE